MTKHFPRKFFVLLLLAGALAFCWQLAVNVFLTEYVESRLIPETAARYGIDAARVEIVKIGLDEIVISPVRLGQPERPFLEATAVTIRYTPWGLFQRHIEEAAVRGLTLNADLREGTLTLPGWQRPANSPEPAGEEPGKAAAAFSWPVTCGKLSLGPAMINLTLPDRRIQLPLSLVLTPADQTMEVIDGRLHLPWRGQPITVEARAELDPGLVTARLTAPSLDLDRLSDFTAALPGLDLSGTAAVNGHLEARLRPNTSQPVSLIRAGLELELAAGRLEYQSLRLEPDDSTAAVRLALDRSEDNAWKITLANLRLEQPAFLRLDRLQARMLPVPASDRWQGDFAADLAPSPGVSNQSPALLDPLKLAGTVRASLSDSGRWELSLRGGPPPEKSNPAEYRWQAADIRLTLPAPALTLTGEGGPGRAEIKADLRLPRIEISPAADTAGTVKLADLALQGRMNMAATTGQSTSFSGDLRLSTGQIAAPGSQVTIRQSRLFLPLQWPDPAASGGELTIGPVSWQGRDLGAWQGTLRQAGKSLELAADYQPGRLLTGLTGRLSARVDGKSPAAQKGQAAAIDTTLMFSHDGSGPEIDLGRFIDKAAGIMVNGDLAGTVKFVVREGRPDARLTARLDDGSVRLPKKNLALTGLAADLIMPDLLTRQSEPAQLLSFAQAELGEIRLTDGRIRFQLEQEGTLFVEQGAFQWCRGHVYSQPTRIAPGRNDYDLTLYCDRLNLAEVLAQIGGIRADGQGTVSGRIPVQYRAGDIGIDDGFLFSAPGKGGIIHLSKTEILTSGLSKTSPQYGQIDLAREALRNYQYDWAKVLFNSEADNLRVRLQFDGRPTHSLPFVYDKKKGGFVRTENNQTRSEFEGIS
ncbi:MAG: YdbH domain-containing protein, partial [Desulfosudaceae bacterium]